MTVAIWRGLSRVSLFIQTAGSSRHRLPNNVGRQQGVSSQEAVMTEAHLLRQYAKEAMHSSSKSTNENEKRDLIDLACTWAQAALMSERVLASNFTLSPHDVAEATSLTR